jgi:hypothetical protein
VGVSVKKAYVLAGLLAVAGSTIAIAGTSPEEALEKELGGWVAGEPVQCIPLRRITGSRALGDTMLFKVRSSIKYRTSSVGCPAQRVGLTLMTNPGSTNLCKGDVVGMWDLANDIQEDSCQVGNFTPYRRK